MEASDRKQARSDVIAQVAGVIHRLSGHVEDHKGETGGCYRAAEEILAGLPSDIVEARVELQDITNSVRFFVAERNAWAGRAQHYKSTLERIAKQGDPWAASIAAATLAAAQPPKVGTL